jgi:hypothetical protein
MRLSPVDCYIEGGYDYFGEAIETCPVGTSFFSTPLSDDAVAMVPDAYITPYNWCHFARAWPFASLFVADSSETPSPPSPQTQPNLN